MFLMTISFVFGWAEALRLYGTRLTAYERLEMEHYPEIWYLGLEARKIHGEEGAPQNGGYDDENGSYHKVRTHSDHVHSLYTLFPSQFRKQTTA